MIKFEDLDLICRVDNHFYKVVIDGFMPPLYACKKCALFGNSLCNNLACNSPQFKFHYHYEEITKETYNALRRLVREG